MLNELLGEVLGLKNSKFEAISEVGVDFGSQRTDFAEIETLTLRCPKKTRKNGNRNNVRLSFRFLLMIGTEIFLGFKSLT